MNATHVYIEVIFSFSWSPAIHAFWCIKLRSQASDFVGENSRRSTGLYLESYRMICRWWSTCWRSWCSGWACPFCRWRRTWSGRAPRSAWWCEPRPACCWAGSTSSCPSRCRSCSPAGWSPCCREGSFFSMRCRHTGSLVLFCNFPAHWTLPDVERDGHQSVEDDDVGAEGEEGGEDHAVPVWSRQKDGEHGAFVQLPEVVPQRQQGAQDEQEAEDLRATFSEFRRKKKQSEVKWKELKQTQGKTFSFVILRYAKGSFRPLIVTQSSTRVDQFWMNIE